ncbi:MAG: glycosyltransferase family 2 protein [Acidobacteriota bacterium]
MTSSSAQPPYFSVVIPTYNRVAMLQRVLDALETQIESPSFDVIVINDGSTDDTVSVMERRMASKNGSSNIRFQSQQNGGPGKARNRGVEEARGKFVVFIGDDTVPEKRFLAEHASVHRNSGHDPMLACLGFTGWPVKERVSSFMHYINNYGDQFGYKLIEDGAIVPFNFFYTSNISIARDLLDRFPFDTSFRSAAWEDIELAYRLEKEGMKIFYNASAVTRHYHPMTVESFTKRQYVVGRSGAVFYSKYPELGHFLGVHELAERGLKDAGDLGRLRDAAVLGERFRPFARKKVFRDLLRQHYLRGLRDGLIEMEAGRIE